MKYYDERGFRVPAPRHDSTEPKGLILGVAVAIVSIFLVISIALWVPRDREAREMEELASAVLAVMRLVVIALVCGAVAVQ